MIDKNNRARKKRKNKTWTFQIDEDIRVQIESIYGKNLGRGEKTDIVIKALRQHYPRAFVERTRNALLDAEEIATNLRRCGISFDMSEVELKNLIMLFASAAEAMKPKESIPPTTANSAKAPATGRSLAGEVDDLSERHLKNPPSGAESSQVSPDPED